MPGENSAVLKPNEPVDEKLMDLSKKTGLSVLTLMQIKKVESKIHDHKRLQDKTLAVIEDRQENQNMLAIAAQIRQFMLFKNVTIMRLHDLLENLQQASVT